MYIEELFESIKKDCLEVCKIKHYEFNFLRNGYEIKISCKVDYENLKYALIGYIKISDKYKKKNGINLTVDYIPRVNMKTGKRSFVVEMYGIVKI